MITTLHRGGYGEMITVLHRGGYAQMIKILHRGGGCPNDYNITWGGVSRDPQK